jgi:hypothetical protein
MKIGLAAWPYRSFGDCFRTSFVWCFAAVFLCMASLLPSARCAEPPAQPAVAVSDQPGSKAPDSITGNPAAENELPGLFTGTFFEPAVSYIPTPGANPKLDSAWALTFRFTFLF